MADEGSDPPHALEDYFAKGYLDGDESKQIDGCFVAESLTFEE